MLLVSDTLMSREWDITPSSKHLSEVKKCDRHGRDDDNDNNNFLMLVKLLMMIIKNFQR